MYQEHYEAMLKLKERLARTENERDGLLKRIEIMKHEWQQALLVYLEHKKQNESLRTKLKDARRVAEAGADMSTMVENTWFRRIVAIIDEKVEE